MAKSVVIQARVSAETAAKIQRTAVVRGERPADVIRLWLDTMAGRTTEESLAEYLAAESERQRAELEKAIKEREQKFKDVESWR